MPVSFLQHANGLYGERRFDEAVAFYDKALALKPDFVEAWTNRGAALRALRRYEEALASYDRAIALRPGHVSALNNKGNVLKHLNRGEEALIAYEAALAVKPDFVEAIANKGGVLGALGRFDEAMVAIDQALALNPNHAPSWERKGFICHDTARFDEALACYDRALAAAPHFADAYFGRSWTRLLVGDWERGLVDYEHRWARTNAQIKAVEAPAPQWAGEPLAGKRLLVFREQGLGDNIQFCRYLPALCEEAGEVVYYTEPQLKRLLGKLHPKLVVTSELKPGERFDYQIPLMSLLLARGTRVTSVPGGVPYLFAEPARAARWKAFLPDGMFTIGVAWNGHPHGDNLRTVPLAAYEAIASLPNVRLVSLQKGAGVNQIAQVPFADRIIVPPEDFDAGEQAFLDTAGLIENLDLTIVSDTSIAHVAGAMGKPVFTLLKQVPDWRWLLSREDCPWYPSMRLFRQTNRGDWAGVMARVFDAVKATTEGRL